MSSENYKARFHRVGYNIESIYNSEVNAPEDYDLTVELILRGSGLWGSDISVVEYAEDMPHDAQKAYNKGVVKSGGILQLSMFFKPDNKIYFLSNSIGRLASKVDIDDHDLVLMSGLYSIVVSKCFSKYIDTISNSYEREMINLYTAIGGREILGYEITGGMTIQEAFSDQIKAPEGVPSPDDKVLLVEAYIGYIAENLIHNKSRTQKITEKVWEYVSSLLNFRLTNAELEVLIRSALEHRRSTTMT